MSLDCECGVVARGAGGDQLVAVAQAHAHEAHLVDLTAEGDPRVGGVTSRRL